MGVPAPRAARVRVRGDGHPRRPGDRARPRGVLRGADRPFRSRPGRWRAPALRLASLRRHVLRRRTAPRARHDGDGARDGARDAQGWLGLCVERGHARAWRRRRRSRPAGGEGPRHQRARAHAVRVSLGVLPRRARRAARRAGGGLRASSPAGGSPGGCCVCPAWGAAPRRSSPRAATVTPASPSTPARAVPRLPP